MEKPEICGGELLIDVQLTRLSQARIQYPIQTEIPKSIPLTRILLYLKFFDLEIVGMRCGGKEVKK